MSVIRFFSVLFTFGFSFIPSAFIRNIDYFATTVCLLIISTLQGSFIHNGNATLKYLFATHSLWITKFALDTWNFCRCHVLSQSRSMLGKFIDTLPFSARLWYSVLSVLYSLEARWFLSRWLIRLDDLFQGIASYFVFPENVCWCFIRKRNFGIKTCNILSLNSRTLLPDCCPFMLKRTSLVSSFCWCKVFIRKKDWFKCMLNRIYLHLFPDIR